MLLYIYGYAGQGTVPDPSALFTPALLLPLPLTALLTLRTMLARGVRQARCLGPLRQLARASADAADGASCSGRGIEGAFAFRCLSTGDKQTVVSPEMFDQNPHATAQALAAKLSPAQRAILAAALAQHTEAHHLDEKYFEELFRAHDKEGDTPGVLTR